ncbi:hypothetical protein PspLS_07325, partial [Pyricularia sp. CBS 133598]
AGDSKKKEEKNLQCTAASRTEDFVTALVIPKVSRQEPVNYGVIDSIAPANRSGTCFCPSVHYEYDGMCGYVQ